MWRFPLVGAVDAPIGPEEEADAAICAACRERMAREAGEQACAEREQEEVR